MRRTHTLALMLCLVLSSAACDDGEETSPDTIDDATDTSGDVSDTSGEDTAADTGGDTTGASCANNGDACGAGAVCVQSAPPYCSVDYLGACEALPSECPTPAAGEAVVGCDGTQYASACEARRAGDLTWLEAAP